MNVSTLYLKNHLDLGEVTPEQIAEKLTFAGAEVEAIRAEARGSHLVIGEILSCAAHPDSDHLRILQVDEGPRHGIHQIVCGAPNARAGLKVIVARTGALLPGGEIKPCKIRGVDSDGMCCSLLELGVDEKTLSDAQKNGIEELPPDAPVGEEEVLRYLDLDDVILEVSVLPNRPDLNALENVAREVGCLFGKFPSFEEVPEIAREKTAFRVSSATSSCEIFTAAVVRGVKIKESPRHLKRLLASCGIRSINNVVDLGNAVMLLTGQPLNLYDYDKLKAKELRVVDDYEGEFAAMDGNVYAARKGDLVVMSGDEPGCLAGIMTADACRVDETTKNVVVEAALFHYAAIRRTSNRLGLSSDSSSRFCKGINPDQMVEVQNKIAYLLQEIADAEAVEEIVAYDVYPHERKRIRTTLSYLNSRLGTDFPLSRVLDAFARDHLATAVNGEELVVDVPPYRIDMDGEADLSEELIRVLGYGNIVSALPATRLALRGLTPRQEKRREARRILSDAGLYETVTYSLVSEESASIFRYLNAHEALKLKNPLTVERSVLRPSLLPSLLSCASYNVARQNADFGLFEASDVDAVSYEGERLAFVLVGDVLEQGRLGARRSDFYDAKGLVEKILSRFGLLSRAQFLPWTLKGEEMHPGRSAEIRVGKTLLGYLGELHPACLKKHGLRHAVVCELDFGALCELKTGQIKAVVPPKFPSVRRDLAVLLDKAVTFAELKKELLRASPLIRGVEAFDVYEGKGIPEGKKSVALTLELLGKEKTLQEGEIVDAFNKAISALKARFGGEIRGL